MIRSDEQLAPLEARLDGRSRIFAWIALLMLPFIYFGWTLGKTGFVLDDWFIWRAINVGLAFHLESTRPILAYPMVLLHLIASNNIVAIYSGLLLVHAISAILVYEVTRHLLVRWLAIDGAFLAFLIAACFILYPSDVSRLWLTASFGARWTCIEICVAALIWIAALDRNRPVYTLAAIVVVMTAFMRAESGFFAFAIMPMLAFAYGRKLWSAQWLPVATAWYVGLFAYILWRLDFAGTSWAFGHFGAIATNFRPVVLPGARGVVRGIVDSLQLMTIGTVSQAATEHDAAVVGGSTLYWLAPVGVALGTLLVIGAWFSCYGTSLGRSNLPISLRAWIAWMFASTSLTIGGLLPFIFNGANTSSRVVITGILSRFSAIGVLGISNFIVAAAMFPFYTRYRAGLITIGFLLDRRVNLVLAGAVCIATLTVAMVRQEHTAENYVKAWTIQKAEWRAILNRNGYWQAGSVILYHDFPVYVDLAPMANQSWAIRSGLAMMLDPAPTHGLRLTLDSSDMRIFPDNAGETAGWVIQGGLVSIKWAGIIPRLSFPIESFVALGYDRETDTITPLTVFPVGDLSGRRVGYRLYTGTNLPMPQRRVTSFAHSLLDPWPSPKVCTTVVPVNTSNAPKTDGAAQILDEHGDVLERRFVRYDTRVNFSFYVRCGTRLHLNFLPSEPGTIDAAMGAPIELPASRGEYIAGKEEQSAGYVASFR